MKRLEVPDFQPLDIFDACTAEMGAELSMKFIESRPSILDVATAFACRSVTKTWCHLPKARHGHSEDVIAGKLTKGALVGLYDEAVLKSNGRPREIYDQILLAAGGTCPYCAGIGTVKTLDHYLPKARFPALSVHPYNLIPACRDCNTEAGAGFPTTEHEQPIHPYLDSDCFFSERWVYAEVIRCDPVVVTFAAKPPAHWPEVAQMRARKHFADCKLRDRFSSQVAGELSPLLLQRMSSLSIFSPAQFEGHLRVVADDASLLLNGWKRTMYLALCESPWFCAADFNGNWLVE